MQHLLPPSSLEAVLDTAVLNRRHLTGLPALDIPAPQSERDTATSRRMFMKAATVGLSMFGAEAMAKKAQPLVFSPDDEAQSTVESSQVYVTGGPANQSTPLPAHSGAPLKLGEIPEDFWYRPRELWIRRQGTREEVKVTYWRDGQLVPEGYWQACALLRDVRANVMTTMDPTLLDILRGVVGFYQAWNWPHPVVLTSGFRTQKTNNALSKEGAAKNSMHLYGKAADMYVPGVPPGDIAKLALHLRQGGVGFYPSRGFTHIDTGRLRSWRG